MGITASFCRITPERFAYIQLEKKTPFEDAEEIVDVDKSWDVLDRFFGGRLCPVESKPLTWIFFPSDGFVIYEDQYMTESVRYLSPHKVKEVHQVLAKISEAEFSSLYDNNDWGVGPRGPYPGNWKKTPETYSEIIANASQLSNRELESLVGQLNLLRAQRVAPSLSKKETSLLNKINEGFPTAKWSRLVELDAKMELSDLTEAEAKESLSLATELEGYTVERFKYLKKLALIRGVSVEVLMDNLGITPH